MVWNLIPQISANPVLCETIPQVNLTARKMMENQAIVTAFMGSRTEFSILSIATKKMMGVVDMILMPGKGQTTKMAWMIRWNLMEEAGLLPLFDECPTPSIV